MKRIAILLALVLPATLIVEPAFATPKPGFRCKAIGQVEIAKAKKFTCIQVGNKLIWNRGVSNKIEKVQKSTVYIPWAVPTSNSQISKTAKSNFRSWLNNKKSGPVRVTLTIDPAIPSADIEYLKTTLELASQSLLSENSDQPHAYISVGDEWVLAKVKADYPIHNAFTGKNICYVPNPTAGCAWPNYGLMFFVSQSASDWSIQKRGVISSGAHEFFHVIQDILLRNDNGLSPGNLVSEMPSWFFEGSATFIGTAYADLSGLASWEQMRMDEINYYQSGRGKNEPLSSFQKNLLDLPQPEAQSHRPYGIGFLACEYIVASVGMDKFLEIYKKMGGGLSFAESFEAATGKTLVSFYENFDGMRSRIGFFPVSKN